MTVSEVAPLGGGTHCAGIGCAHDGLVDPDHPTWAPAPRSGPRHLLSPGRRRGTTEPAHRSESRAAHAEGS